MNPRNEKSKLAVTHWDGKAPWYVADLPGCDKDKRSQTTPNADWGYTTDPKQALPISPYWQRRFKADSARCNRCTHFYSV